MLTVVVNDYQDQGCKNPHIIINVIIAWRVATSSAETVYKYIRI